MAQTISSPKQCGKETSPRRPVRDKHSKVLSPRPSPKVDRNKKQHINLPPKSVPGKLLPPLSCSAERKDAEVESEHRTHSVSKHTTGSLYQLKDHRPIPRLDPSRLPQHGILLQYEILDNNYTKPNSKKQSGPCKSEQMRYKKQQTEWTVTSLQPLASSRDQPERFQRRNEADLWLKKLSPSRHSKEGTLSSGLLRLDTMELAKGVSLLDPQADDINSVKFNRPVLSVKLRPIRRDAAVPLYSVEQVATGPPPQVTPLFQSKN